MDAAWASIVVAIVAGTGSLIGNYLAHRKSSALIGYRLEQLEKEVAEHNRLVDRTYRLESSMKVVCHELGIGDD